MTVDEIKSLILDECKRIGDEIIQLAKEDRNGIYWDTIHMDADQNMSLNADGILYTGVPGIVLFLTALSDATNDSRYLECAEKAMPWLNAYCKDHESYSYAFISGRTGAAFTFLEMYKTTGNKDYLQTCLEIIRHCPVHPKAQHPIDDFINGTSGTIVGLLHIYDATKNKDVLTRIENYTINLIERANIGPKGLYWDRSQREIHGLCGFSHGSAGLGFTFLELGHYFQNDAFYWIAEEAFEYETFHYDSKAENWPDFRCGIYDDKSRIEHEENYNNGNLNFFTKPKFMNAWCHGAAGIGLSRVRASELLKKKKYQDQAMKAVRTTINTDIDYEGEGIPSYTYCHGSAGNAEVFINAFVQFKEKSCIDAAIKIAENAVAHKAAGNSYSSGYGNVADVEDLSLFMGNAGLGYYLLRVLNNELPSLLAPSLREINDDVKALSETSILHISKQVIQQRILKKIYPITIKVTEKAFPTETKAFFASTGATPLNAIRKSFASFATRVGSEKNVVQCIVDALQFENSIIEVDRNLRSNALTFIESYVAGQKAEEMRRANDEKIQTIQFVLNEDCKIVELKWDWVNGDPEKWLDNLTEDPGEHIALIKGMPTTVDRWELNQFNQILLTCFEKKTSVASAVEMLHDIIETENIDEKERLRKNALQQIVEFAAAGILLEV